uniref:Uncharacterized protein n=1 Tax=Cacopsylla melanoneura TaxID=428564 RepID=A0A8D9BHU9_9HEMI
MGAGSINSKYYRYLTSERTPGDILVFYLTLASFSILTPHFYPLLSPTRSPILLLPYLIIHIICMRIPGLISKGVLPCLIHVTQNTPSTVSTPYPTLYPDFSS